MRIKLLSYVFLLILAGVTARLFYWQVLEGEALAKTAALQRSLVREVPAERGSILARDGKILVSSEAGYLLFASSVDMTEKPEAVARKLAPILLAAQAEDREGLILVKDQELPKVDPYQFEVSLVGKLSQSDNYYIPLARQIKQKYVDEIKELAIDGIGFDSDPRRMYPEGALGATTLGFVGSSNSGEEQGYFGLEGFYNGELTGRGGVERLERDAAGRPILIGSIDLYPPQNGRTLVTTIDRYIQFIVEKNLREGVERYGAKRGTAVVMDPKTGEILASATVPSFDPRGFQFFTDTFYKDGAVNESYEPGSTFKILTMAAGLDSGLVTPDTPCPVCNGPLKIQDHEIKTWNNQYFPSGETMIKVLEHSNNVGSAWLAGKIGREKFYNYAKAFGVGEQTGIDLQGEESGVFYQDVSKIQPLDLATMGFGQGFSLTALKMLQIAATVANEGKLTKPHLVTKVMADDREIPVEKKVGKQVIKPEAARALTAMLVRAVENGEARRLITPGYRIAGKTGTAQIPIAGHYDPDKTIASFVGFAPAEDPKFVMIVKYVEPTTTPHGATTAVPTFMAITRDLFGYFGLSPTP